MADTTVSTDTAGSAPEILPAFPEPTEPTTSTESADPAAATTTTALAITAAPVAATALETSTALAITSAPAVTTKRAGSKPNKDKQDKNDKDDDEKAINKCMRAWNYAYRKTLPDLAEDQSDWQAEKAGNAAYLQAAPPLIGHKNICNFIACINHASVTRIVSPKEAAHYMANARVALSTIYHQPKTSTSQTSSAGEDASNGATGRSGGPSNPPPQEEMK